MQLHQTEHQKFNTQLYKVNNLTFLQIMYYKSANLSYTVLTKVYFVRPR